jgi:hypothetical protein
MQFAIGVTVLECSFVKHSHGPLGVKYIHIYKKRYDLFNVHKWGEQYEDFCFASSCDIP